MSAVEVVPPPLIEDCAVPPPEDTCCDAGLPEPCPPDCQQPPEQASLLAGFYALSLQVQGCSPVSDPLQTNYLVGFSALIYPPY